MKKQKTTRRSLGFTLIEFGIVLALAGIGLFFAISKLTANSDQSKAQNMVSDVTQAVLNTKRLFNTQTSYATVTVNALRDNSVFPATWIVSNVVTSPFTGAVTAAPATLATANDAAEIMVPNVPSAVCSEVARMLAAGIEKIDVGGTNVKAFNGALDIAALGTQCASALNVNMNVTFGKL